VMMKDSPAPSKVIVLLTDGDNNAALDPVTAAQAVTTLGMRVYVIGMGTTGVVPVPNFDGTIQYVENTLDEATLGQIAEAGNGLYFRAEDIEGLRLIYDEINQLERSSIERQVFIPWQDQVWGVLVGAFILLIFERILRRTIFQSIP
jgi:Ca-activated chloride channel homolog